MLSAAKAVSTDEKKDKNIIDIDNKKVKILFINFTPKIEYTIIIHYIGKIWNIFRKIKMALNLAA